MHSTGYKFVSYSLKCLEHSFGSLSSFRRSGVATDSSLIDRIHPRDYLPSRDYPAYRDEPGRYARDSRHVEYTPAPARDYRRPLTPPGDHRDHAMPPPRSSRDNDDYRMRAPPPPPPPPSRYDRSERDRDTYSSRYPPPPPRDHSDRYDRRSTTEDRYVPSQPPYSGRPRTPPGPPPSRRDDEKYSR